MGIELQFELWQECNTRCSYCSLGKENMFTPDKFKMQSLDLAFKELSESNLIYDVVGFIGGEFFQGQLILIFTMMSRHLNLLIQNQMLQVLKNYG